jgi:AraC-like DNA-binding protein
MSPASRVPVVSTALVPALLRFARGRGASLPDLKARFELDGDAAEADEVSVAPGAIDAALDAVEALCGEPWTGLRLAADLPLSPVYAPIGLALESAATVGHALLGFAPHIALVHPLLRATWVADDAGGRWTQTHVGSPRSVGRHSEEYGLAFVLARCREACADLPLRAESVSLSHPRPRDTLPLQRFFGTERLTFGADQTAFSLTRAVLDTPLRLRPKAPTVALVTAALPDLLPQGATLERVAQVLGMSDRTLQRRLEAAGTSFLEVQDGVRETRARQLLHDPALSLLAIAEQLGFSDLATFSRAFKRWTGEPPGMFRRKSTA